VNISIFIPAESTEGDIEMSDGDRKCVADASLMQTTPKRRATLDYKEKDSNEVKVFGHVYSTGKHCNDMEGDNLDVSSPDVINRGRGRPTKVPKHRTTVRVQRRCQELKVVLELANEEQQL
jgi:hypothetical protein